MRTIALALLLILPLPALAMDTSLDRPVSREEAAKLADKAKGPATEKRPASAKPGANASDTAGVYVAECRDGKRYYHPTGERRGACSGHQGVAVFADGTAPKSKGGRASYR